MSARVRPELGFVPLIAVVFFNVSGGPYGIEDAVSSFGPGLCLVLLVLTPLVWSLPVALAMSELAAALPEEGGYVEWVRRAFGPFWGFQAGWWSWLNSFVDVAVYPALFADYLKFWWPNMSSIGRWAVVLAFIWILTAINLAGVRITGVTAVGLGVLALAPMLVFTAIAGMAAAARAVAAIRRGRSRHDRGDRPRARRHDVELLGVGQSDDVPRRDSISGAVVPARAVRGAAADHARLRAARGGGARRDRPLGGLGHGLLARGGGGGRRPAARRPS